jgi:hypothetical protein
MAYMGINKTAFIWCDILTSTQICFGMKNTPKLFLKAGMAALLLIIISLVGFEYYWRSQGYQISFNDDKMLWANERRKIYEPADRLTVFAGSSRIKWDIDIDTWEKLTGEKAVQLALVGTSPRKIILDLANDENFSGKVVVDVMEPLVFGLDTLRMDMFANESLEYYYNETPAQRASAKLDHALESKLVLLDEGKFGLNQTLLEYSQENNRPGVVPAPVPFKKEYVITTARRQNKFTPVFLNNPQLIEAHKAHWIKDMWGRRRPGGAGPAKDKSLDSLCLVYKAAFDKIRARGGTIVFIRPPSNGPHLGGENKMFPRKQYWERLLQVTNTPGIHYTDYPATAAMVCTEDSHLNLDDAIKYTTSLVGTLKTEYGWKFRIDNNGLTKN